MLNDHDVSEYRDRLVRHVTETHHTSDIHQDVLSRELARARSEAYQCALDDLDKIVRCAQGRHP